MKGSTPNTDAPGPEYPLGPALEFLQRIWQLNHAVERGSSRMEKRLGVTAQQRFVLRCIGKYPGMTAHHISKLLHADPGTVSVSLRRLEAKGLLERRRDPRDKRKIALGLTASGRRLDGPLAGTIEEAAEILLRTTAASEIQLATSVLEKLATLLAFDEAAGTQVPT